MIFRVVFTDLFWPETCKSNSVEDFVKDRGLILTQGS